MPNARPPRTRTRRPRRQRKNRSAFTKAPIPNKFATKLRYQSYNSINPGVAGIAGVHVISANGLFDPDITGVGHQPRGFDQFMTMYDHYTVVGSKITVNFSQLYGNAYDSMQIGLSLKDSSTVYSDPNEYQEGRNVRSAILASCNSTQATHTKTLTMHSSTKKFLGVSHPLSSSILRGDAASNPSEEAYFHIWCAPNSTADNPAIVINFRIEYLVVFTEPKNPSQS